MAAAQPRSPPSAPSARRCARSRRKRMPARYRGHERKRPNRSRAAARPLPCIRSRGARESSDDAGSENDSTIADVRQAVAPTSSHPGSSTAPAATRRSGTGADQAGAPAGPCSDEDAGESARREQHHRQEEQPDIEQPGRSEQAQHALQQGQQDRAEDRPEEVADAADEGHQQHVARGVRPTLSALTIS